MSGLGGAGVWAFWKAIGGAAPTLSSLNYSQGDTLGGGQSIVLTGTNFTGATAVKFGTTNATFVVNSPTQITATLPAHAAGVISVTVVGPGGTSGGVSFEFWNPSSDGGLYHWLRSDLGATTAAAGTELAALADQSGTGDTNKNIATTTTSNPLYSASDANFGGMPSWGTSYSADSDRWMTSGSFSTPQNTARTVYQVMRIPTPVGTHNYWARINNAGSGTGSAFYGVSGAMTATVDAAASIAVTVPLDTTKSVAIVYNNASSAAYIDSYTTASVTGSTGDPTTSTYTSLGTGSFPTQTGVRYRQTEIIVSAGAHNATLRGKYGKYFMQRYGLTIT